jgi:hypothetical protein
MVEEMANLWVFLGIKADRMFDGLETATSPLPLNLKANDLHFIFTTSQKASGSRFIKECQTDQHCSRRELIFIDH